MTALKSLTLAALLKDGNNSALNRRTTTIARLEEQKRLLADFRSEPPAQESVEFARKLPILSSAYRASLAVQYISKLTAILADARSLISPASISNPIFSSPNMPTKNSTFPPVSTNSDR